MSDSSSSVRHRLQASNGDPGDVLADALKDAGLRLVNVFVKRTAEVSTERIDELSDRLSGYAANGGAGFMTALTGGKALAQGKSPLRAAMRSTVTGAKESATNVFRRNDDEEDNGGGGTSDDLKAMNIVQDIDVGLPLRTTYDLWTQYEDFPRFMKKVENVEQESDEKTNWRAQVFWSHRMWEATTIEQVPDSHIVFRSTGEKGHVNGAVTFTELGPNLTRILLVLQYHPQGFVERTGNIWRAVGRRARLELKHFRRHAMVTVLVDGDEVEGWRGEIRDGEVVKTHEDALEEEREQAGSEDEEAAYPEDEDDEAYAEDEDDEAAHAEDEDDEAAHAEDEDDEAAHAEDEDDEAAHAEDEDDEAAHAEDEDDEAAHAEDENEEVAYAEDEEEPAAAQGRG